MIKEIRFVLSQEELSSAEKIVLTYLQVCAGDKCICYPSVGVIARDLSISERHVVRALKSLQDKGWIEISRCAGRKTNMYKLKIRERMGDKVDERILKQAIAEAKKREDAQEIVIEEEKSEEGMASFSDVAQKVLQRAKPIPSGQQQGEAFYDESTGFTLLSLSEYVKRLREGTLPERCCWRIETQEDVEIYNKLLNPNDLTYEDVRQHLRKKHKVIK